MGDDIAALVERVIDGDVDAFGVIVKEYQDSVRAHLAARLRDRHEADDLAQEVFLTAYSRIATYDPERPIRAWLRGITDNLLRNYLRKRRESAQGSADEIVVLLESRLSAKREHVESDGVLNALRGCLQGLDDGSRSLIEKRYADEMPLSQLCAETRRKHSALTMALHRLREKLRDCVRGKLAVQGGPV